MIFYTSCVCVCVCAHVRAFALSHSAVSDSVAHQAPLSMRFSRQEYWSGWPVPPPGALRHPGIKPASPVSSALASDSFPLTHLGIPYV